MRLDRYLVENQFAPSREKARRLIEEGRVEVESIPRPKPSTPVGEGVRVRLTDPLPFVSRDGEKLARALDCFGVNPEGAQCLDVGASTGGFTDCLLQRGAARVVAVDVGHGQMDPDLSRDPRVRSLEGVNARSLDDAQIGPPSDLIVIDLSFISLDKVLPGLTGHLRPGGDLLCLVKPQFEAGRERIGRSGVVRDHRIHREVLRAHVLLLETCGLGRIQLARSQPAGRDGNREFWSASVRRGEDAPGDRLSEDQIRALVNAAFEPVE